MSIENHIYVSLVETIADIDDLFQLIPENANVSDADQVAMVAGGLGLSYPKGFKVETIATRIDTLISGLPTQDANAYRSKWHEIKVRTLTRGTAEAKIIATLHLDSEDFADDKVRAEMVNALTGGSGKLALAFIGVLADSEKLSDPRVTESLINALELSVQCADWSAYETVLLAISEGYQKAGLLPRADFVDRFGRIVTSGNGYGSAFDFTTWVVRATSNCDEVVIDWMFRSNEPRLAILGVIALKGAIDLQRITMLVAEHGRDFDALRERIVAEGNLTDYERSLAHETIDFLINASSAH